MNTHKKILRPLWSHALLLDILGVACIGAFIAIGISVVDHVDRLQDVAVYRGIASRVTTLLAGSNGQIASEYPPLATLLFWAAKTVSATYFGAGWIFLYSSTLVGLWLFTRYFLGPTEGFLFPFSILLSIILLGIDMTFGRFDLFIAMPLLLAAGCHRKQLYAWASFFLWMSICIKVVPILAVPVLFLATPRKNYAKVVSGAVVAVLIASMLPILVMGFSKTVENISYMTSYHSGRGIQLETIWSGISLLFGKMYGYVPPIGIEHAAFSNFFVPMWVISFSKFFIVAGVALLTVRAKSIANRDDFHALLTIILFFAIAFAPVFSPQYLVWCVPLLIVQILEVCIGTRQRTPYFLPIVYLLIGITLSTYWMISGHYWDLVGGDTRSVFVLNFRNGLILILLLLLSYESGIFVRRLHLRYPDSLRYELKAFLIDALLFSCAAYLFFVVRPAFIPYTKIVTYTTTHAAGSEENTMRPLSIGGANESLYLTMQYVLPSIPLGSSLHILQDDCLEALTINGYRYPSDQLGYCEGSSAGRLYNLHGKIHAGTNTISAFVRNTGGPVGFSIIAPPSPILIVIGISFLIALVWFVCAVLRFLALLHDSIVSFLPRIRYTLLRTWITLHLSPKISSPPLENQQMDLSI